MRICAAFVAWALVAAPPALAKKKTGAAPKQATAQTARAISELMGKFKWDQTLDDAMKVISDDLATKFDAQIKAEKIPAKQDVLLKAKADALAKMRDSYVKFDGQKTGWDVSIIDKEFVHKNNESMFVIWEGNLRRFLFFQDGRLWKQFIAFNAENPVFAGKTFDDFAAIIQAKYGPAAMTFRKQRTNDEQTLDHLEWPPSGDYLLWAIDLTTFYGNFCLSLMRRSAVARIEKSRAINNPAVHRGNALVDSVTKGESAGGDANADVVDEITGRTSLRTTQPSPTVHESGTTNPKPDKKPHPASNDKTEDPLEGLKL